MQQQLDITQEQLGLLFHTLGLSPEVRDSRRNLFLAGPQHSDLPNLQVLVDAGLMKTRPAPAFCPPGDILFTATKEGLEYALHQLPARPKRKRWGDFTNIQMPFFESKGDRSSTPPQFRMRRNGPKPVSGEWAPTKKDAKASYKSALQLLRKTSRQAVGA